MRLFATCLPPPRISQKHLQHPALLSPRAQPPPRLARPPPRPHPMYALHLPAQPCTAGRLHGALHGLTDGPHQGGAAAAQQPGGPQPGEQGAAPPHPPTHPPTQPTEQVATTAGSSSTGLIQLPPPLHSKLFSNLHPPLALQSGATCLQVSGENGHDSIVSALLEHKAQPTQQVLLLPRHAVI